MIVAPCICAGTSLEFQRHHDPVIRGHTLKYFKSKWLFRESWWRLNLVIDYRKWHIWQKKAYLGASFSPYPWKNKKRSVCTHVLFLTGLFCMYLYHFLFISLLKGTGGSSRTDAEALLMWQSLQFRNGQLLHNDSCCVLVGRLELKYKLFIAKLSVWLLQFGCF